MIVVDPGGVASGASGGVVGALAPHVPENWNPKKQFQFESLMMADAFWAGVAQTSGLSPGYVKAGRLQPLATKDAVDLAQNRVKGAKTHWHDQAVWEITQNSHGWKIDSPSGAHVFDTLSAHIHPRKACEALAEGLRVKGVVFTDEYTPDHIPTLWATGASGLHELGSGRPRIVGQGIKGQAALLQCDLRGLPQLFVDGLHIIPHLDATVAIGSTTERDFIDPLGTDALLDDVVSRALTAVPQLNDAQIISQWAGLRPRARSRAPMLGAWPARPGHFIANGGFKIGFGMAPKIAAVMTNLILEDIDDIPPGFRVEDSF